MSDTIALLRQVRDKIATYQDVDMGHWFEPCGTAGCIAGEILLARGWTPDMKMKIPIPIGRVSFVPSEEGPRYAPDQAAAELGLWTWETDGLFYLSKWPKDLLMRYAEGDHVGATVERINRFIAELEAPREQG